jgi:hypothetical protein
MLGCKGGMKGSAGRRGVSGEEWREVMGTLERGAE